VKLQLQRSIERQIEKSPENTMSGLHCMHHVLSLEVQDEQGRHWKCIKEERSCILDNGGYYHMASVIRNFQPACDRAAKVSGHITALAANRYKQGAAVPAWRSPPVMKSMTEGLTLEGRDDDIDESAANEMRQDVHSLMNEFEWNVDDLPQLVHQGVEVFNHLQNPVPVPLTFAPKYSSIRVRPLDSSMGAEVLDCQIQNISVAQMAEIQHALCRHKLLYFRQQAMGPTEHDTFCRSFKDLGVEVFIKGVRALAEDQELFQKAIEMSHFFGDDSGYGWHSDLAFTHSPPATSMLQARDTNSQPIEGEWPLAND